MTNDVTINKQISECFKLLSIFFAEPELKLWEEEGISARFVGLLSQLCPGTTLAAVEMQQALSHLNAVKMKVDHAALFIGPYELLAAPYGSTYLENKKQVMGDSTQFVRTMYDKAGLSVDVKELPDHIVIELEFMYYLYSLEFNSTKEGEIQDTNGLINLRHTFLTSCLAPWIPQFCEAIRQGTDNQFYKDLAKCLQVFIEHVVQLSIKNSPENRVSEEEHVF